MIWALPPQRGQLRSLSLGASDDGFVATDVLVDSLDFILGDSCELGDFFVGEPHPELSDAIFQR
jgi:hypothetical protein